MTTNSVHRTEVLQLTGPKWVAVCSCGWTGAQHDDHTSAKITGNDHKMANRRLKSPELFDEKPPKK